MSLPDSPMHPTERSIAIHSVFQLYRYLRTEGYEVGDAIKLCGVPVRVVKMAIDAHGREWVESLPTRWPDEKAVRLIWGDIKPSDFARCKAWVNGVKNDMRRKWLE